MFTTLTIVIAGILPTTALARNNQVCTLPNHEGSKSCTSWSDRWYFDNDQNRCIKMKYTGCGGNGNNFLSLAQCNRECAEQKQMWNPEKEGQRAKCFQPKMEGPCHFQVKRYFYNVSSRKCERFYYGGCQGNANNFPDQESCIENCQNPISQTVDPTTLVERKSWQDARCGGIYLKEAIDIFPHMKCTTVPMEKYQYNRDTHRCEVVKYYGCPRIKGMNLFDIMVECKKNCE